MMHGPTTHNWQVSHEIDPVVAVRWHCLRIPRGVRHALGTRRPPGFFRPNASGDGGAPVGQARMIGFATAAGISSSAVSAG
jgi:hypothetical protein